MGLFCTSFVATCSNTRLLINFPWLLACDHIWSSISIRRWICLDWREVPQSIVSTYILEVRLYHVNALQRFKLRVNVRSYSAFKGRFTDHLDEFVCGNRLRQLGLIYWFFHLSRRNNLGGSTQRYVTKRISLVKCFGDARDDSSGNYWFHVIYKNGWWQHNMHRPYWIIICFTCTTRLISCHILFCCMFRLGCLDLCFWNWFSDSFDLKSQNVFLSITWLFCLKFVKHSNI